MRDKRNIIRWIKFCEILIMLGGATGLMLAWNGMMVEWIAMPLMFTALLAMGVHSTFFGPIKYAILPQHLKRTEVLAGTGLVEAGTYVAILAGMILGGWLPVTWAAAMVIVVALAGFATCLSIPSAPPLAGSEKVDWNIFRASWSLMKFSFAHVELRYSVLAISLFWTIAAILSVQFIPLAKNVLSADKEVASVMLVAFSAGIAIGSASINHLLKGKVSARYSAISVIVMGLFLLGFYFLTKAWQGPEDGSLLSVSEFMVQPMALLLLVVLLLIAVAGGMFVVPLYAFLTTKVDPSQASRSVAANNLISSLFMTFGAIFAAVMGLTGVPLSEQLLVNIALCVASAALGHTLFRHETHDHEHATG
jgi:MFS family permease